MGMFDNVCCEYPLPWPEAKDFGFDWQTKSPGYPSLDRWEIRADGTLWHEDYDTEDRSDPNETGLLRLRGCMTKVNKRWVPIPWNGEFEIYHLVDPRDKPDVWYEVRFWFRDGVVKDAIPLKREK